MIRPLFHKYFELVFWIAALLALAVCNPAGPVHYTLCPFKLTGFKWCPGCGIGHSIAWLLHGNIKNSFQAHWLGIPALIMILYRIGVLAKNNIFSPVSLIQPYPKESVLRKIEGKSPPLERI